MHQAQLQRYGIKACAKRTVPPKGKLTRLSLPDNLTLQSREPAPHSPVINASFLLPALMLRRLRVLHKHNIKQSDVHMHHSVNHHLVAVHVFEPYHQGPMCEFTSFAYNGLTQFCFQRCPPRTQVPPSGDNNTNQGTSLVSFSECRSHNPLNYSVACNQSPNSPAKFVIGDGVACHCCQIQQVHAHASLRLHRNNAMLWQPCLQPFHS